MLALNSLSSSFTVHCHTEVQPLQKETQHGILRTTVKLWFDILVRWQSSENWFLYRVSVVTWMPHHENFKPLAFSRTELWPFPQQTRNFTYLRKSTIVNLPEVGFLWNWCQHEVHDTLLIWLHFHAKMFAGTGHKRALKFCCTVKLWFNILVWWQSSGNWFLYCVFIILWMLDY